ncbi:hypothetical protein ACIA6D_23175 [Streptomyces cacaoi]
MNHTTTASEWAQMVSLAVSLFAGCSAPYFLLVDAEVWRWPRPLVAAVDAVRPSAERAADRVLVRVANARFDAREMVAEALLFARLTLRDSAFTATALLALFTINPEHR